MAGIAAKRADSSVEAPGVLDLIGNTPMVGLERVTADL